MAANIPYELYTVHNGLEALAMLRGSPDKPALDSLPDLLLLDLNMPRMNGLEFLTALRKDGRLSHIKVYIMTTSEEHTDREMTERLGVEGYLVKPMSYGSPYNREGSMEHFVRFHMRNILMGGQ